MIIYYNPDCSKCNDTLQLLEANHCQVTIREYLKEPPTREELKQLLDLLRCKPLEIIRKREPLFQEKFAGKQLTDEQWIGILCENPVLIERPIVINGDKAIIGRPPQLVVDFIK